MGQNNRTAEHTEALYDPEQQRVLDCFHDAADTLAQTLDLTPANPNVTRCLSAFVQAVLDCPGAGDPALLLRADVRAKRCALLRKLAEAEFQMELFYAQPGKLSAFPYHDNYRDLVTEEILALGEVLPDGAVYFIGSGPLPLTAVEFARQTDRQIICVERDPEAAYLSRRVIAELNLSHKVSVIDADGSTLDYADAGLVMVAALVDKKDATIFNIRQTAPQAMIGIRSAEGLRTLLYDEIDPDVVARHGYDLSSRTRVTPAIVNTTLFFKPQSHCTAPTKNAVPDALVLKPV